LDKKDSKKETKESFVFEENVDEEEEVEEKEKNSKSGYIWQYFDGGWCNYDFNASEAVDQVYDQWKKNPGDFDVRSVRSGQYHYMVDFRQMTQTNVDHENHTTRKIRRQQQ